MTSEFKFNKHPVSKYVSLFFKFHPVNFFIGQYFDFVVLTFKGNTFFKLLAVNYYFIQHSFMNVIGICKLLKKIVIYLVVLCFVAVDKRIHVSVKVLFGTYLHYVIKVIISRNMLFVMLNSIVKCYIYGIILLKIWHER